MEIGLPVLEKKILSGFYHIWAWRPSWSCDQDPTNKLSAPQKIWLSSAKRFQSQVYSTFVRSVMLHAAETWTMTVATLNRLRRNDRAMIRWICKIKANDEVSSDSLLSKLGLQDIDVVLRPAE